MAIASILLLGKMQDHLLPFFGRKQPKAIYPTKRWTLSPLLFFAFVGITTHKKTPLETSQRELIFYFALKLNFRIHYGNTPIE